ncbi:MAG TPA: hypothetical protein DCS55_00445, partial [Acidimicrobiaceae bacterium]|nr:hypothetical protein [Acidimicrobiaceae bacterium]
LLLAVDPSGPLVRRLVRGELDLVVCVETDDLPAGLTTQPLLDDPLSVLAPGDAVDVTPAGWGPWVTFPSG